MSAITTHTQFIFDIMVDSKTKEQKIYTRSAFFCQIKISLDSYALALAMAETTCEEIYRIHYAKEEHFDYKIYPVASKFWNMRVGQI